MAATVGSLFELQSERILELINKNVDIILPSLDPAWRDTFVSSQGVGPTDAIGRDMQIIKVFQGGMTGVLEQGKPRGDVTLFGDQTAEWQPKIYTQSLTEIWPDPTEGPNQNPYRLAVPMRSMMANIMFTLGELQAEALPAVIGQIVAPKLEGFARNISHTLCNYWYTSQNTFFKLSTFGTAAAWVEQPAASGYFVCTFEPDNFAVDRYYVGQRLDVYTADGATRQNEDGSGVRYKVFVSSLDELTNKVTIVTDTDPTSGSLWAGATADHAPEGADATDILVYAESRDGAAPNFTGIAGINSWMKTGSDTYSATPASAPDNYLLGGEAISGDAIEVDRDHPEHKSFAQDLAGQPMTEHKLRQYLRRFHAAKNKYGYYIDCLIASDGVWLAYEATKIGRELLDRTGRLSSIKDQGTNNDANFGGFEMTFDGRTYMGYTSCYIEDGVMYGIRKGGENWKRYVPPDPKGVRNFDRTEPFIPFKFVAGSLTGLGTSQLPIYDTASGGGINRVTEGTQMPGMLRMQLVPDQPCGMRLHNIGTDRVYSDETEPS